MADDSRGCSMQGGYAIYHMAVIVYGLDFKICSVQAGTLVVRISTGWDWKTKFSHRMKDLCATYESSGVACEDAESTT